MTIDFKKQSQNMRIFIEKTALHPESFFLEGQLKWS
jgi:hypothetical protein